MDTALKDASTKLLHIPWMQSGMERPYRLDNIPPTTPSKVHSNFCICFQTRNSCIQWDIRLAVHIVVSTTTYAWVSRVCSIVSNRGCALFSYLLSYWNARKGREKCVFKAASYKNSIHSHRDKNSALFNRELIFRTETWKLLINAISTR